MRFALRPLPRFLLLLPLLGLGVTSLVEAQQRVTELGLPGSTSRRGVVDPTTGEALLPSVSSHPRADWVFDPTSRAWRPRPAGTLPTSTGLFSVVADTARNRVVLFGGSDNGRFVGNDETWEWDGNDWHRLQPSVSPPPRTAAAACFDRARGRMVLFGGLQNDALDDTWEFDGTTWIDQTTHPAPAAGAARLAYDPLRAVSVLRGSDGTWEWDGSTWTGPLDPTPIPTAPAYDVVWDSASQQVVTTGPGGSLESWNGSSWSPVQTNPVTFGASTVMTLAGPTETGLLVVDGDTRTWSWDGSAWHLRGAPGIAPGHWPDRMVYDPNRRRLLLLDEDGTVFTFDRPTRTWRQISSTGGPVDDQGYTIAYDAARDRLVAYGPGPSIFDPSATWLWDPRTDSWQSITLAVQPPRTTLGMSMEYDPERRRCVLFGGLATVNEQHVPVWEWDGTLWHRIDTTHGPSGRNLAAMAYDSDARVMVMVGSPHALGSNEVWAWDGSAWSVHAADGPAEARVSQAAAYHPGRRRMQVVVQAMTSGSTPRLYEIDHDRGVWEEATLTGRGLDGFDFGSLYSLAHDPTTATTYVVHSNRSTARALETESPASATVFGTGCASRSGRVPELTITPTRLPWVGDACEHVLTGIDAGILLTAILVGASETSWSGGALPFDLGPAGLTGCTLFVSPNVAELVPVRSGAASGRIPVPDMAALVGRPAFLQGLVFDPAANPAGVLVTNAVRMEIGAR